MPKHKHLKQAFTIVELLIVIIVIAILAAITIIAYNGITNQASTTSTKANLSTVTKKVALKTVENGDTVPTSLTQAGITNTENTEYRYSHNTTDNSYCISAIDKTSKESPQKAYYATNTDSSPKEGRCLNHEDVNYMTNLMPNSGFERTMPTPTEQNLEILGGWYDTASGQLKPPQISEEFKYTGSRSLKVKRSGVGSDVSVFVPNLERGVRYGISYRSYSPHEATGSVSLNTNDINGSTSTGFPTDDWRRSIKSGIAQNGHAAFDVVPVGIPRDTFAYLDDVMLVKELTVAQITALPYRDGDSPNWIWNIDGTSIGPKP